jgi:hypothetical protein
MAGQDRDAVGGLRACNLMLRPGPHGLIAEADDQVSDMPGSARLDLGLAADLLLSGAAVLVHWSLLGRGQASDRTVQPSVTVAAAPTPGGAG